MTFKLDTYISYLLLLYFCNFGKLTYNIKYEFKSILNYMLFPLNNSFRLILINFFIFNAHMELITLIKSYFSYHFSDLCQ